MKKHRRSTKNNLSYGTFEPRQMLAGNITASLSDGLLRLTGDDVANEVLVIGAPDGSARVVGINGTTINGGSQEFSAASGFVHVLVQLGDGNDDVTVQGLNQTEVIQIQTGGGDDRINVHHIETHRLEVSAGDGDNVLEFNNVYCLENSSIQGGVGKDIVSIVAMAALNASIVTGDGDDSVAINHLGVKWNTTIDTGTGNDSVALAGEHYAYRGEFLLGAGDDTINIAPTTRSANAQFQRSLRILGGDGDDNIALDASVKVLKKALVDGQTGTDSIQLGGAELKRSGVHAENDSISNLNTLMDSFYASLADGDVNPEPFGGTRLQSSLTSTTGTTAYSEGDSPVVIDDQLVVKQGGATVLTGATIAITSNLKNDQDILSFTNANGITGSFNSTNGTLTLTGNASANAYQTALRSITYNNTSENPDTTDRTITFTLETDAGSPTATRTVSVARVNDAPTVTAIATPIDFDISVANRNPIVVDASLTAADPDSQITSATVTISAGRLTGDVLAFTEENGITGSYNASTGVLTFTGTASVETYQKLLRTVTFDTGSDTATGQRSITFELTDADGEKGSAIVRVNADTNFAPTLSSTSTTLDFTEGDSAEPVDTGVTLTTDSVTTISGATVSISGNYQASEDTLAFANANGITGSFNSTNGTLTLTGNASASAYQTALRSVTYHNGSDNPNTTNRTITFEVTTSKTDPTATRTVSLTRVNDSPSITARTTPLDFDISETSRTPVVVDANLAATDPDSQIASATVTISAGRQTGDVLAFTEENGITGSYNATTGVLSFTGTATVETYQKLLRTVTFNTGSNTATGQRSMTFEITDGDSENGTATVVVNANSSS